MRKVHEMQTRLMSAIASLLAISGCNSQSSPEVVDYNPDPMAKELANLGSVELPPSIKAEQTFRCKDNSLVKVTFFSDDKKVFVRPGKTGPRTILSATSAGEPFVAEGGWSLTGDTKNIILTQPDQAPLTCRS